MYIDTISSYLCGQGSRAKLNKFIYMILICFCMRQGTCCECIGTIETVFIYQNISDDMWEMASEIINLRNDSISTEEMGRNSHLLSTQRSGRSYDYFLMIHSYFIIEGLAICTLLYASYATKG